MCLLFDLTIPLVFILRQSLLIHEGIYLGANRASVVHGIVWSGIKKTGQNYLSQETNSATAGAPAATLSNEETYGRRPCLVQ